MLDDPHLQILCAALAMCIAFIFVWEVIAPMLSDQQPRKRTH